MLKKTITYKDYNGTERTEDFYFNLSKAELIEMQANASGGLEELYKKIIAEKNIPEIYRIFKDIVLMSYGEKSVDGKRFIKTKEAAVAFTQTEAFSVMMSEFLEDPDKATEFANGIIPPTKA